MPPTNAQATGAVYSIGAPVQVTDKFRKRVIVLTLDGDPKWPKFAEFEAAQDRCNMLDQFAKGDRVTIGYSLDGRQWKDKIFNTLRLWTIDHADGGPAPERVAPPPPVAGAGPYDDVPFASCALDAEPSGVARVLRGG